MPISYIENEKFIKKFHEFLKFVRNDLDNIQTAIVDKGGIVENGSYHLDSIILNKNIDNDPINKVFNKYILPMVYKSELFAAGSGHVSILYYDLLLKEFLYNKESILDQYNDEEFKFLDFISQHSTIASKTTVKAMLKNQCATNDLLFSLVWEAIQLSGIEGNISCEDSDHYSNYTVELSDGYNFPVKVYNNFIDTISGWEKFNTKILCIDGIVDKVSEIDKILIKSSESGIPMIIVAQGFGEEVIATIATNNKQRRFNIIPVILEQQLENINIVNDIAICAGGDTVSILKGQLLTYINYDEIPVVDWCKATNKELIIQNKRTRNQVAVHINQLLNKRNKQQTMEGFDIGNLLEKRIKNLLTHSVKIRLPSHISNKEKQLLKLQIDIMLRTIKAVVTYGVFSKEQMQKLEKKVKLELKLKLWEKFLSELREQNITIPTLACYCAVFFNGKHLLKLLNSSGMIVENKENKSNS